MLLLLVVAPLLAARGAPSKSTVGAPTEPPSKSTVAAATPAEPAADHPASQAELNLRTSSTESQEAGGQAAARHLLQTAMAAKADTLGTDVKAAKERTKQLSKTRFFDPEEKPEIYEHLRQRINDNEQALTNVINENREAVTTAQREYADADFEYGQTNPTAQDEVRKLLSESETAVSEYRNEFATETYKVEQGTSSVCQNCGAIMSEAQSTEKSSEKNLEKDVKTYEKNQAGSEKNFDKSASDKEKQGETNAKTAEKSAQKEEKESVKEAKKMESNNNKYFKKTDKANEKANEAVEGEEDENDEHLRNSFDHITEMDNELTGIAEQIETSLEKLGGDQEHAFNMMDRLEEAYYTTMYTSLERAQSGGVIKATEDAVACQAKVKAALLAVQAAADAGYTDIESLEDAARSALVVQEDTYKNENAEVLKEQRNTETADRRLEAAFEKSKSIGDRNRNGYDQKMSEMKDAVKGAINKMKESGLKQVGEGQAELEHEVMKDQDRQTSSVDKDSEQIRQDTELRADETSESFESGMEKTAKELNKVQRGFESTSNGVYSSERRSATSIGKLSSLDSMMGPALVKFGEQVEKTGRMTDQQAATESEEMINTLVAQVLNVMKLLKEQSDAVHAETLQMGGDLSTETDGAQEQLRATSTKMTNGAVNEIKQVAGMLKPVEEAQHLAGQQLTASIQDIGLVTADAERVRGVAQQKAQELLEEGQSVQEELNSNVAETFSKEDQYQASSSESLTSQLQAVLQSALAKFDTEAAQVHDVIKDAEMVDAGRASSAAQRDNTIQLKLGREESTLGKQEAEFGPKYKELLAHLTQADTDITDLKDSSVEARNAFKTETTKETNEKIQKLVEQMRSKMEQQVNKTHERTLTLQEEVANFKAQADSDKDGTKKSVEEALAQTEAAYQQILSKVGKLHEKEQSVNSDEWVGASRQALDRLKEDAAARMAKMAKLEDGFAEGDSRAGQEISDFAHDQQNFRNQFESQLAAQFDGLSKYEEESRDAVTGQLSQQARASRQLALGVYGEEARLQGQISNEQNVVASEEGRALNHWKMVDRQVADKKRSELQQIDNLSAEMARDRTAEQARQAAVERDLAAQGRAVQGEVGEMEGSMHRMMGKLDPTGDLSLVTSSINSIGTLMEKAQGAEHEKAEEVEHDVKLTSNKIAKIMAQANLEDGLMSKAVMAVGLEVQDKLRKIKALLSNDEDEFEGIVGSAYSTGKDVLSAQKRRFDTLKQKMDGFSTQVEKLVGLQKYQGEDAVRKVVFVMDKAAEIESNTKAEVDDVVVPTTDQWRSAVESVFEGLGMALDLEKVERMAAASMAAEEANGGGMKTAKERMDAEIANIKMRMQSEIDFVRAEAERLIQEIMNDESLSAEEKAARIAAIRKKADRDVYLLMMQTKKLIADQYTAAHKLDEEIGDLNALLERARLIAGSGTPEAAKWARAMMAEVKKRLDVLRHRFETQYSLAQKAARVGKTQTGPGAALLEIEHQVAQTEAAVHNATRAGTEAPRARAAAFLQAGEELSCLLTERKSQDDELDNALDVLQDALPMVLGGHGVHA